jgi:hypothetical protein
MADVFISYARADDEAFVRRLRTDLHEQGVSVWWDRVAMESRGRTFLQEIRDAISECGRLLLVVGPGSGRSEYVRAEWQHALDECKVIVPVLRMGAYSAVPAALSELHSIDFRDNRAYPDALAELMRILATPVPGLAALSGIISLPPHFVSRRQESGLLAGLVLADLSRPVVLSPAERITAVVGMGGVGKSSLVASFARSCASRRSFSDGIVWLKIGQEPSPLVSLQLMAEALGEPGLLSYTDVRVAEAYLARVLSGKNILLVLDDVWDVGHVNWLANAIGSRCRLVLTTRSHAVGAALQARELRLDVFDEPEALELLARWTEQDESQLPADARAVLRESGNLPLAVAMVGAMVHEETRWDSILHLMRGADLGNISAQFANYPYPDLLRAIAVSAEILPPDVRERYTDFAVFQPGAAVPEETLGTLWAQVGLDRYGTEKVIRVLVSYSLAQRDSHRRLVLHDLQADYVRSQAGDLSARHAQLVDAYRARCRAGWHDGPRDGYFLEHLVYHLVAAGRLEDASRLLADFAWLHAKLDATSALELLADYDQLPPRAAAGAAQTWHSFLRKNAHLLAADDGRWPPAKVLLQLSCESPGNSLPAQSADGFLAAGRCDWLWIRRRWRPSADPIQAVVGSVRVGDSVLDMAVDRQGQTAVVLTGRYTAMRNSVDQVRVLHVDLEALRVTHQEEDRKRDIWTSGDWLPGLMDRPLATPVRWHEEPWQGLARRAVRAVGHTNPELPREPVMLARDGRVLVTGTHDGVIRLWSVEVMKQLKDRPEGDHDARRAIDHARRQWEQDWRRWRQDKQGQLPMIHDIEGGDGFEKIAFRISSTHQLDIVEVASRRLLASWRSSMPLTHPAYDNMMLSSSMMRAVVSDGGIAVETASGTALSLEIVNGHYAITPRNLDRLVVGGS